MLSGEVDKIRDKLHANLRAAGEEQLPTFGLGATFAAKFKSVPAIAWVPVSEKIVRPPKRGPIPGALWMREVECVARISAEDIDACEELQADLANALHQVFTEGAYALGEATWDTAGVMSDREILAQTVTLFIEITRPEETEAVVEEIPETFHIDPLEIGP